MHPGINDQRGEDCGSFTLIRGKERGRTHSEAMLSSLVHAFRQSSVKKPSEGHQCVDHNAPTRLIFCLYILHRFIFASSFLFISSSLQHILPAVFVLPPPFPSPPSLFSSFPSSILGLICHFPPMARSIHQASSLCVFLLPLASLIFFFLHLGLSLTQMDSRARPPPFLWT